MRLVLQRVSKGSVSVDGTTVASIQQGLVILLGIAPGDSETHARTLAEKVVHLRIFEDDQGKMNRSLLDIGGEAIVVSQFTLYADTRKGRRPSFTDAAPPDHARPLVERFAGFLPVALSGQQAGLQSESAGIERLQGNTLPGNFSGQCFFVFIKFHLCLHA